jgi:hypothetical protein
MGKHQPTPKDEEDRSGYAEEQPHDRRNAQQPAPPARPSPDEPGMERDADAAQIPRKGV